MTATSSSWTRLPAPMERADLGFTAWFTNADAEQMMRGFVPEQMEDKWFIYFDDGWLYFHRSWTGVLIYALRLEDSSAGVRVVESWVNRNPEQHTATDTEYDQKLVRFLIDAILLKKPDVRFPMPRTQRGAPKGVVQHHIVGKAYSESKGDRLPGDS